jgi:parallel beta-helix repeat protein
MAVPSADGNKATSGNGGGVQFTSTGSFYMNKGNISANTATGSGGGVSVTGGSFTMTSIDAVISKNKAGTGGGVAYSSSTNTFVMAAGYIGGTTLADGNEATSGNGGGVSLVNANFNMDGNSCYIQYNTASNNGGGVYFSGSGGNFLMKNGNVGYNTANVSGGGVYFGDSVGSFLMTGGTIKGNKAPNGYGGGVYIALNQGIFRKSGNSAVICGSNSATDDRNLAGGANYGDAVYYPIYYRTKELTATLNIITAPPASINIAADYGTTAGWNQ